MKLNFAFKSSLVAALTVSSLLFANQIALNPKTPVAFSNVSKELQTEFEKAGNKPLDSVLLVDGNAIRSSAFLALAPKLKHLGGSIYQGPLSASDLSSINGVDGITLDLNRPASAIPVSEAKPKWEVPDLLWDAAVTVPQTDPALQATRAAKNVDGRGIMVAVLDTGVDPEALGLGNGKVVHREDFTTPPTNGACSDNGKLDPFGHGTHVSSMIAGAIDSRDSTVEGVAPGASIVDLRVLNCEGSGEFSGIDQALQWILDHRDTYPVKIVNMSLGASDGQKDGLDPTAILINRLVAQGIFVAVAAGNGYAAANNLFTPATAEFGTTVASATVNKYGKFLSPFSSHGPTSDGRPGVDLTAPGAGIRAALTTAKSSLNNYSVTMSGTSMATPYVAGLAALLLQQHPTASPTGTLCDVSADCPSGVVKSSMTNALQDLMKTSDWFEPGIDPHSGAGVVSATDSLNATQPATSKSLRGTISTASENLIQIPPHAQNTTMTLLLDASYRESAWDRATFNVIRVDSKYSQTKIAIVCTLLAETSCLFGESGWTPRLFNYYLPASTETTTLVIRSSKDLAYTLNIDSYSGGVSSASGVKASNLNLDGSPSGSITLERTATSATATVYSLYATGGLGVASSVTLPAGPAGTAVTVAVTAPTNSSSSLDRVVFTDSSGGMVASSVRNRTTGDGPLIYPNAGGFDDSDQNGQVFLADDGSLLGASVSSGVSNSSGYANPFRVAAGSRSVVKYEIAQTSSSQIDTLALSQDGSAGLFKQFPSGAGVVPGDDTVQWTYFVRNLNSGQNFEVGPDWRQWAQWNLAPTPAMVINEDGTAAAWAVVNASGDKPNVLVAQTGPGLATKTTLDSFAANSTIWLFGYSNGKVLMRIYEPGGADELRLYSGANNFEVLPNTNISVMTASFSQNGQAVGFANGNSEQFGCSVGGVTKVFPMPTQLGSSYSGFVRVANDCSWLITVWDKAPGFPRGQHGTQLIRVRADGGVTRLDETAGTSVTWITNLPGTIFLRSSSMQLEPGDINGMNDLYRGLGQQSETAVHLRTTPTITWKLAAESLVFGTSMTLSTEVPETADPATYRVVWGQCHIIDGRVFADAGLGSCGVEAKVAENADWLSNTKNISIPFTKATRPANEITLSANATAEVESPIRFTFSNPTPLPYSFWPSGVCGFDNGQLIAHNLGTCTLTAVRAEDNDWFEARKIVDIQIIKKTWSSADFAVTGPSAGYLGDSFDLGVTNRTGQQASSSASGSCSIDGNRVTLSGVAGTCTLTASVTESQWYLPKSVSTTLTVSAKQNVAARVTDLGWLPAKLLPKGSTLTFNSNVSVTAGPCTSNGRVVSATAASGTCTIRSGGYSAEGFNFEEQSFTIKLGGTVQTWTLPLPTYTTKKLTAAKYTFITNGQPKTNQDLLGVFTVTTGCKIVKLGKTVAIDMGKLKKCVVTLKAAAGFRVPGLTKTWTFTR